MLNFLLILAESDIISFLIEALNINFNSKRAAAYVLEDTF